VYRGDEDEGKEGEFRPDETKEMCAARAWLSLGEISLRAEAEANLRLK
jgi:hypothetical protein